MHEIPFLVEFVILFGTALFVLAVCNRFHIPQTIGLLITGILSGPSGLHLIGDTHHVKIFAELGVVFLLFIIGLELSLQRLRKIGKIMLIGGSIQAFTTVTAVTLICFYSGLTFNRALFFGLITALSSTAIVLKIYQDQMEIETPHGRSVTGILLFQDFLIVPFLLIVPVLGGIQNGSVLQLLTRFGGGLVLILLLFLIGRFLLPHFLHFIVHTRIRELLVIGSLFACLGSAILTHSLGFSLALGAFLAGILISETDYHYQIQAEITPFRDVFNSIFFISIGMLVNLQFGFKNLIPIFVISLIVILLKTLLAYGAVASLLLPKRTCFISALSLAQIGEFSFVLISTGYAIKLISFEYYQIAISVTVLTMLFTPILISIAPKLVKDKKSKISDIKIQDKGRLEGHIIIAGFGLTGQHISRVLTSANIQHIIVELNGRTVSRFRNKGVNIIFGDVAQKSLLEKCHIQSALTFIPVISDPFAVRQSIKLARQLNPDIYIITRSNRLDEIEELKNCGANQVIAQEFESSIEIVTHMLTKLNVPRNVIQIQSNLLRQDGYQMLREPVKQHEISDKILQVLASETTTTFLLFEQHAANGKTIKELGLRQNTGVTIISLIRKDKPFSNPSPDFRLQQGDILVLMGSHAQLESAFKYLEKG
ncbi:cation:proton antiporter [candidate division KSB1 bacterium]|nr:cation:proton antiporter [candidate division KSB1 bacterium]